MPQQRLTGLDAAFLAAESPGKPLHMMAVLMLDPSSVPGGYSFERFRDFMASRMHLVPPMRRRLLQIPLGFARPVWVEDPDFDLDLHLRRAAVPAPGGRAELAALAAELAERPLDRSRPLWEMAVVEGVEHGRIAVLAKLHHSMMDGMAGMQFMASLFSREPEHAEPTEAVAGSPRPLPTRLELIKGAVPELVGRPLHVLHAAGATLQLAWRRRFDRHSEEDTPAVSVARTWLNARTSDRRSVAYTSISMHGVRRVARAYSATINDVVLAVVAGALRRDLWARDMLPQEPLVAGVPLSTHEDGDQLANAYSVLFVPLATDLAKPPERLRAIRKAAQSAKRRQRAFVGDTAAAWADVPTPFEVSLISWAYSRLGLVEVLPPICSLAVSNVPGPPVPLYFAGARLVGLYPLGPIFDGMVLNVTALSREDSIDIGLVSCAGCMRDLQPLADALPLALEELSSSPR